MLVMNQIEHLLEQNNSELDASDGLVEQASWNLLETGLHSEEYIFGSNRTTGKCMQI